MYPYPKDNGKSIIISSILEYLISQNGKEKVNYVFINKDTDLNKLENTNGMKIFAFQNPKLMIQLINLIKYTVIKRTKSIQESVLYSVDLKRKISQIINDGKYDLIIYDTIRMAQYFENDNNLTSKEIVYMDDLFSERYSKMLEVMKNNKNIELNPLGNFSKFLPKFSQSIINFKFINYLLLSYEKKLIKKRENEIVKKFDLNLLISKKEVNILTKRTNSKNIKSINPVLKDQCTYSRNSFDNKRFLFLGSLNIPHNESSIINFIEINRNFLENHKDIHIDIVGRNASEKLEEIVKSFSNITIHGYVEDLNYMMETSTAMIVPLIFGSGVKLKTLEAFSKGLPVISTDFGIEGINVKHNNECIVENDIKNFPLRMMEILEKNTNQRISKRCYDFFVENYSKESVYNQYKNLF